MRKSLNEIQQIDAYLLGQLNEPLREDFQIRLLLEPELQEQVNTQKDSLTLVRLYGRKKLRSELQTLHQSLLERPDQKPFWKKIFNLFS